MLRIAVVEDDAGYRATLEEYLQRFSEESGEEVNVTAFQDGQEIVTQYRPDYDLILMDIEMANLDGMSAAEKIREKDDEVVIIFITNTPQYAMNGYLVDALDYVLKPISYFAFSQRISRAITRMRRRNTRSVLLHERSRTVKINVSDIRYVEVRNHDLTYHAGKEQYQVKGTLSDAEATLADSHFFRASSCYLVNLKYVDSLEGNDLLLGQDRLTVSRARKKPLLDALNDYMNEVSM